MASSPDVLIRYAKGSSTNFGKAKNYTHKWSHFTEKFRTPVNTGETLQEYNKLNDLEQRIKKSVAGWWYRTHILGTVRNRGSGQPANIMTLDFDYATPKFFKETRERMKRIGWNAMIHTSRRHTPDKPRFRMVIQLDGDVDNDTYIAVSRIVAREIDPDMKHVDKVSFRPAQMMFMPTICSDSEYVFEVYKGAPCDWQLLLEIFEMTEGDWRDITKLPTVVGETTLRQTQEKAENPTEKDGPVGFFCRAYDVQDAIEKFDLPYSPVDAPSAKPRYTYTGGTTTNGAEVQDGGLFLYSHHGSDPCSDMLVNAFDLVRMHKFNHLDKDMDPDEKSPAKHPSWKAMIALCEADEGYRKSRMESKFDINAMFDDLPQDVAAEIEEATLEEAEDQAIADLVGGVIHEGPQRPKPTVEIGLGPDGFPYMKAVRKRKGKAEKNWHLSMETDQFGRIKSNSYNVTKIVSHDKRFCDSIAFNEFTHQPVAVHDLRSKVAWLGQYFVKDKLAGDPWEDHYDHLLRITLEAPNGAGLTGWGMSVTDRDLKVGVVTTARLNTFNPVRDTLLSLKSDHKARAETLFIDYLGCPDTPYYRMAARMWLIAAVARVMEPGCKFDYMPVLFGGQGIGKSTFIRILSMGWFGELHADFSDERKLAEQIMGCWIMEVPELVQMVRGQVETAKAFFSAQTMTVRMAYDHRATTFKRQTVFIGSTNSPDFLKDQTGNRRFWPIEVFRTKIDTERLKRELGFIWAEAVEMYFEMRAQHPFGDLPLYLTDPDAAAEALSHQAEALRIEEADIIAEYLQPILDKRVPLEDEFAAVTAGRGVKMGRRMIVTPGVLRTELEDSRVSAQLVATALGKLGWTKTGGKIRMDGQQGHRYVPGPEQLARWARIDGDDDTGGLV